MPFLRLIKTGRGFGCLGRSNRYRRGNKSRWVAIIVGGEGESWNWITLRRGAKLWRVASGQGHALPAWPQVTLHWTLIIDGRGYPLLENILLWPYPGPVVIINMPHPTWSSPHRITPFDIHTWWSTTSPYHHHHYCRQLHSLSLSLSPSTLLHI